MLRDKLATCDFVARARDVSAFLYIIGGSLVAILNRENSRCRDASRGGAGSADNDIKVSGEISCRNIILYFRGDEPARARHSSFLSSGLVVALCKLVNKKL